jgi:threonine dehydrogenase-like Zn-dependent dehydrogenase
MKAVAIFPSRHTVELIEHVEPHITRPDEAKIRILEVGVCGTDRHICAPAFGNPPAGDPYLILGHEALGQVIEVGAQVETLKPGDLVVPEVRRPCSDPSCRSCRAGRQDFCTTMTYTERGITSMHGYMTDFAVDEARYLNVVPAHLRDVAVLIEPLTIAEKALLETWQIQQRLPWRYPTATPDQPGRGLRAVVLGAGPIGLLGAMTLLHAGFETFVYSRSPLPNPKAAIVQAIGATYVSSSDVSVDQFTATIGPIDLVYEAMDASPTALQLLSKLHINGIFIFTSQPNPNRPASIDASAILQHIMGYNQVILGTVNAGHDAFVAAIRDLSAFAQRWPQALRALISGYHPMSDAANVLLDQSGGIKHVIKIND